MDYDDTASLRIQQEGMVAIVKGVKDHQAVLMYAIGNELDYIPPMEPFDPRVWDMVNAAAKAIHAADPHHPVMIVIGTSMMHKVTDIARHCPDLDLIVVNAYSDIYTLQDTLLKYGWTKPYVLTEWGPDGYWEVRCTPWGAPLIRMATSVNLPVFVAPELEDTAEIGKYTSGALLRLLSSKASDGDLIKILVYGQSISAQDCWLRVKDHLAREFPDVHLQMENRSIGGFASQILYKTVEMDVASFYPDLVLLHIYGDPACYDSVLYTIRSRTTAEVSHNIPLHRAPCLEDNQLAPASLLSDDVHLNDYGKLLMAELVGSFFTYLSPCKANPFGLVTKYASPQDLAWHGDTLVFEFTGNRADIELEAFGSGACRVLIDGLPPSAFPGTYYMSRPSNVKGRAWPWELPGMVRVSHTGSVVNHLQTILAAKNKCD